MSLGMSAGTWASIAGAGAGLLGGSKKAGTTTTTTSPWGPAQPYLKDIYGKASQLYSDSSITPEMMDAIYSQRGSIMGRALQPALYDAAYNKMVGQTAPVTAVSAIGSPSEDVYNKYMKSATSQDVNPTEAFSSMGAANPTDAISRMLTGNVNTSALDPVVNNAMRRMTENFNEQVMPGINQGAIAAGQYGGSRQGVAQGLATKGLNYAMGDTAANMYNNAFNTAQGNMYGTANNMAGLAINNATNNANRQAQTSIFNTGQNNDMLKFALNTNQDAAKFNANLGLQNNDQSMKANMLGADLLDKGNQVSDSAFSQTMGLLDYPNAYSWNKLKDFNNIISSSAGMGGSRSEPYFTNPGASALGGALTGAQIYNLWNNRGA